MRGRYLYAARAVLHVRMFVRHYGYGLVYYGQDDVFADKFFIPFVGGVDRDGGVAEHRLGAGCGDYEPFGIRPFEVVFYVPEAGIFIRILHLRVRKGGAAFGAPVYYPVAVIYEPLVVEVYEHLPHRARTLFVHRKGKARPVAGRAELFELRYYPAAVLFLPVPCEL